ncbi:hypothetical protein [Marispirochaeta sp.]|jgi:hypothetical protein|uniref:hypothetical protein n=1 Tax=Marispirochaeta sp. TaxID=2038653 RepID=UPI0029C71870|nr:hypothetical protein [Marispirochaeta sp.]
MAGRYDLNTIIRGYSLRMGKPRFNFTSFAAYAQKYIERLVSEGEEIDPRLSSPEQLEGQMEELAAKGVLQLEKMDNRIKTVFYPKFYYYELHKFYKDIEQKPEEPFPSNESTGFDIPDDAMTTVDVKTEFVDLLKKKDEQDIIRLTFPETIPSILTTSTLVENKMLEFSVQKIRNYLNTHRNAEYMQSRMRGIFRNREASLKDMFSKVLAQSRTSVASMLDPTDFSFQFWTHLASSMIQEYNKKNNRTALEHAYIQSAYLLGLYNMYYKSISQREKDKENALKQVRQGFRNTPYFFTFNSIHSFKDKNGVPLSKRFSLDDLNAYLRKLTTSDDNKQLPEIVRVRTTDNKEYFIHRELIIPLTLKKLRDANEILKREYQNLFTLLLNNYQTSPEMKNDEAFIRDLERRLKEEDPLLAGLLRFDLLFFALESGKYGFEATKNTQDLFDSQHHALKPLDEVLKLKREDLVKDAKFKIPLWKTISLFVAVARFLRGFSSGFRKSDRARHSTEKKIKKRPRGEGFVSTSLADIDQHDVSPVSAPAGGAQSKKKDLLNYKEALEALKRRVAGNDKPIDQSLDELAEKWNPLYDPRAKSNLVEDVNSLIRDFIRSIKRHFRVKPPDLPRIENMARQLSEHDAFNQIKNKGALMTYIKLYIIKILGNRPK